MTFVDISVVPLLCWLSIDKYYHNLYSSIPDLKENKRFQSIFLDFQIQFLKKLVFVKNSLISAEVVEALHYSLDSLASTNDKTSQ